MPPRAATLLAIAVAVAVLLLGAASSATATSSHPAHRDRCAPRGGERLEATSSVAVVLSAHDRWDLIGCSRATGARHAIGAPDLDDELVGFTQIGLRGTRVVLVEDADSRAMDHSVEIAVDDALRPGHRRTVWLLRDPLEDQAVGRVRIGPGGTLAWLTTSYHVKTLRSWRPGDAVRTLDQGVMLDDVALDGGAVRWTHAGAPHAAALAPPDRCALAGLTGGDAQVDLLRTAAGLSACDRGTGATAGLPGVYAESAATAGTWVAAPTQDAIIVVDTTTGARRAIPAGGRTLSLVVDAAGSIAWVDMSEQHGSISTVYADDGAGTHALWTVGDWVTELFLDGTQVIWPQPGPHPSIGRATLTP